MAKKPQPPVPGPPFIRLLAALADRNAPRSGPDLADRLSQWIDWTRAVALSRALDGRLPAVDAEPAPLEPLLAECLRVRETLAEAIRQPPAPGKPEPRETTAWRTRCLNHQRAMLMASGRLRGLLRDRLATLPDDRARLADVDAVMEQALSPREQALLASVPALLGTHFERLRDAAGPEDTPADGDPAWLQLFRTDMQNVLMAELDVRFHPIDGLLAALRAH